VEHQTSEFKQSAGSGRKPAIGISALASLCLPIYIHLNSGVLASTPKAPPGNIYGPRARFFVLEWL